MNGVKGTEINFFFIRANNLNKIIRLRYLWFCPAVYAVGHDPGEGQLTLSTSDDIDRQECVAACALRPTAFGGKYGNMTCRSVPKAEGRSFAPKRPSS
jgi:hypothetical protein